MTHGGAFLPDPAARAVRGVLALLAGYLALVTAYLLTLLAAAAVRGRAPRGGGDDGAATRPLRFIVLVPAHDEEEVLGDTLGALDRLDGDRDEREVVVIADHCSDRTAEIARGAGATVLERSGGGRGKGHALRWALEQLGPRLREADGVLVLDADCEPSPNLLRAIGARLRAGAVAVQADNVVSNPGDGPAAEVRDAAFRLMNTVRPMGRDALGLSAGLRGTGMAFTPEVLEQHGWASFSLVEDFEQHYRLVEAGVRVAFAGDGDVRSAMPASHAGSVEQQARWESTRFVMLRTWFPRLVRSALRERDLARVETVAELLVPPQSLLLLANGAVAAGALVAGGPRTRVLATCSAAGQAVFVLGGLKVSGAPPAAYRGLLQAPVLVAQKLVLARRLAAGRGPGEWVRTDRAQARDGSGRH